MFLFEGVVYDLLASFVGLFFGVGGGVALIWFLRPIMDRFDFPLKFSIQPHSIIVAYCLGVLFTFGSVVFSSWLVSRMNVIEALRDLPEPPQCVSLRESVQRLWLTLKLLLRHT
jgi:putative ABC transport system permease protein